MKNFLPCLMLLCALLQLGCTKVVYTHEQVVDLYKTKQDLIKAFKMPTEKKTNDSTEEWLYRYDRNTSLTDHSIAEFPNVVTTNVTEFSKFKRYIIFTIDKRGNVIMCYYKGVDLAVRKKNTGGTIALIALGVLLVAMSYVGSQTISFSYVP